MTTLIEKSILNERLEKSRSGIYADTSENRRKHRVGQKYGSEKKEGEKPEKTSSNKDPEKELEAVNKVIAAINEGKLTLPNDQIMVLVEKKSKLEAAKKQAEKINAGVKANEEKKGASDEPEILQWGGKKDPDFRKGTKEQFQNLYKKIEGKTVDLGYYGKGKVVGMQVRDDGFTQAIVQTSKGSLLEASYSEVLEDKVEDMFGGGSLKRGLVIDPKALSSEKEKKTEEKKDVAPKEKGKDEVNLKGETEVYTRVKFDDVPNSGKVNLKKYLSDKVKRTADENLGILSKVSTENLKKMEAGLVKEFNSQFGSLSKSRRAEKLYSIMKVKSELENRKQEEIKKYQKYTSSLDDNTLWSIGYDLGEEIRELSSRGFSTLEQQEEVLKKISELSVKRQINEDEQRKRMDKLK